MWTVNRVLRFSTIVVAVIIILSFFNDASCFNVADQKTDVAPKNNADNVSRNTVMRCPTFFSVDSYSGFNLLKQKFSGYISEILCADEGRVALLPPISSHADRMQPVLGPAHLIPFDQVYDIDALNEFMYPKKLLAEPVTESQSPRMNEEEHQFLEDANGIALCKRRTTVPLPANITCTSNTLHRMDAYAISTFMSIAGGRDQFLRFMVAMKPAKNIRKVGELFLQSRSAFYMCLHLRTEFDFTEFMSVHGFPVYTNEIYKRKLERHKRENPLLYASITDLYIAGDHNEATFNEQIKPLFRDLFPNGTVLSHHSLRPYGYEDMENIQRSALDQHICVQAKIFLGTSKSGWSEFVHYTRLALLNGGSTVGATYMDLADFGVNSPSDSQGSITDEVVKFRGANHDLVIGSD